jgi:rhodanese-related sulfurtransferase
MKPRALREALVLIAISIAFGFVYTLMTKQGFFAEKKPNQDPSESLELISFERAKALFKADSALFIDARYPFEYRLGHIRGSMNVALGEFNTYRARLDGIPKNRLLVVYCDGAQCNSSLELTVKLMELGFTNVQIFFGGWEEWKKAGMPIDTSA